MLFPPISSVEVGRGQKDEISVEVIASLDKIDFVST